MQACSARDGVRIRAELDDFTDRVGELRNETNYATLQTRFGVRRTDPKSWAISDRFHALFREGWPIEAGAFDLSRIENR